MPRTAVTSGRTFGDVRQPGARDEVILTTAVNLGDSFSAAEANRKKPELFGVDVILQRTIGSILLDWPNFCVAWPPL
jgi:hypothetical protein